MSAPFDTLDAFRAAVVVVPAQEAEQLRADFVASRLDPQYKAQASEALALRQFRDGLAYTGYLWDFLADKEVVQETTIWHRVSARDAVFAMWDIHSTERIRIPDYFKFPKDAVLRADPESLGRGLPFLPEDLYLFDDTFEWAGALTHEWVDDERFCVWSGRQRTRVEDRASAAANL